MQDAKFIPTQRQDMQPSSNQVTASSKKNGPRTDSPEVVRMQDDTFQINQDTQGGNSHVTVIKQLNIQLQSQDDV